MKKKQYRTPLTGIVSSMTVMKFSLLSVSGRMIDTSDSDNPKFVGVNGDEDEYNGEFD